MSLNLPFMGKKKSLPEKAKQKRWPVHNVTYFHLSPEEPVKKAGNRNSLN